MGPLIRVLGYAAVWGEVSTAADRTRMSARRGCFAAATKPDAKVIFCIEHDQARKIASVQDGTLELIEDDRGLVFSAVPYDTSDGRQLVEDVRNHRVGVSPRVLPIDYYHDWRGVMIERASLLREISAVARPGGILPSIMVDDGMTEGRSLRELAGTAEFRARLALAAVGRALVELPRIAAGGLAWK